MRNLFIVILLFCFGCQGVDTQSLPCDQCVQIVGVELFDTYTPGQYHTYRFNPDGTISYWVNGTAFQHGEYTWLQIQDTCKIDVTNLPIDGGSIWNNEFTVDCSGVHFNGAMGLSDPVFTF